MFWVIFIPGTGVQRKHSRAVLLRKWFESQTPLAGPDVLVCMYTHKLWVQDCGPLKLSYSKIYTVITSRSLAPQRHLILL